VSWRGEDLFRLPVLAANQFAVQLSTEEGEPTPSVILTIGHVSPPMFLGTPEEQEAAAAGVENVDVLPLARFKLSAAKAAEFAGLLQTLMQQIEASRQQS
jgi:hypothetical protein